MNMAKNKHISIGRLGERIVAEYLERRGYTIRDRNFTRACGELDIVAYKDRVIHVIEVKAASWRGVWPKEGEERYRPEDHVDARKLTCLQRTIACYINEHPVKSGEVWTLDVAVVLINQEARRARVRMIRDVAID
jgi:putative endonuclease